jgi:hypothetical protein
MDHLGAGSGQRQRGGPGVGKEGEDPRAARGHLFEPGPLRRLLEEQPGLAGGGGPDLKVERRGMERDRHPPGIGKRPGLSPATGEPRRRFPGRDATFPIWATGVA